MSVRVTVGDTLGGENGFSVQLPPNNQIVKETTVRGGMGSTDLEATTVVELDSQHRVLRD